MESQYQQGATQSVTQTRSAARKMKLLFDIFNNLFYIVAVFALLIFAYYLFSFQHLLLLYFPIFLQATVVTLVVALISLFFAVIFGLIGAMGRLSHNRIVHAIATAYVEIVRGTPVLVQLLLWFYGLALLFGNLGFDPYKSAFDFMTVLQNNSLVPDAFDSYFYGIIGLSFNYGAYFTEVFRAGIEGIDKGQQEAALSLGLNLTQIMRRIILPQAIRITVPPFTNYFITLIQDTALLSIISVVELEHQTYALALPQIDPNNKMFVFIFGALFYFVLCYPLALLARRYEARLAVAY
jgi:His/Glu/Gln/Arg/opine family amino acid ABC transporter permease subunit